MEREISKKVRMAIGTLRSVLLVYGESHLLNAFDMWKDEYLNGDIDFSTFCDGISLELSKAYIALGHALRDACYDCDDMKQFKCFCQLKAISVLL